MTSGEVPGDRRVEDRNEDGAEIVRSEEVLEVGTQTWVSGHAVLRKRIVTETVTQVVELRREELIVDRQPAEGEGALVGAPFEFADADYEIVLHEERVVVTKQVVPIERIKIGVRQVTDVVEVTDDVRREEVDMVEDAPDGRPANP